MQWTKRMVVVVFDDALVDYIAVALVLVVRLFSCSLRTTKKTTTTTAVGCNCDRCG